MHIYRVAGPSKNIVLVQNVAFLINIFSAFSNSLNLLSVEAYIQLMAFLLLQVVTLICHVSLTQGIYELTEQWKKNPKNHAVNKY